MSLEATIARAVSLNSINSSTGNSSKRSDSSSSNPKKLVGLEQQQKQQEQQRHQRTSSVQHKQHKKSPSSGQQQHQQQQHHHQLQQQHRPAIRHKVKQYDSGGGKTTNSNCQSAKSAVTPSPCHLLVEQIIYTVGELEHSLIEDHQQDFELRMALERQTERVHDLRSSLETEKQRNGRLVQLIRGVDSSSSTDEDEHRLTGGGASYINGSRWQSRSSMDAFESISPLLMQQRYDELALSHKQCRKQLLKKEKLLMHVKCEREETQGRYDHLLDEYRNVQKRFEELCCKYLRLQSKKNQELQKLREALSYASDCVLSAQQVMELHESEAACSQEFRQNLQLFIKALRLCEWVQNSCRRTSSSGKR